MSGSRTYDELVYSVSDTVTLERALLIDVLKLAHLQGRLQSVIDLGGSTPLEVQTELHGLRQHMLEVQWRLNGNYDDTVLKILAQADAELRAKK